MAATQTVAHASPFRKSGNGISLQIESSHRLIPATLRPRRGAVVLYGYGINVRVERGHLILEDGVGTDRHRGRFPRVGHGLERLVVIGADGAVSLSALRWLADQNASFVMLERDGTVLATTGPVRPSEIRLRRAQALAHHSGAAFRISRELIDRKLAGQERVARESLQDQKAAELIRQIRSELAEVESTDAIRLVESRAAKVYWKAWRSIAIKFPEKESPRVPQHWLSFGSRASLLTGSSRLAVNPINAILNYLYALLEAECRLALAALGLDPGMGVLHMDTPNRDSLACDLMEPIRADVDAYVLRTIVNQPLKKGWFFEERNGNCRLSAELASQLAETTSTWARLVAPLAEWIAREIASTTKSRRSLSPTRLTQNRKRAVTDAPSFAAPTKSVRLQSLCKRCGSHTRNASEECLNCASEASTARLRKIATKGRAASHTSESEAKRRKKQQANFAIRREWSPFDQPSWLTEEAFTKHIQPRLPELSNSLLVLKLAVSRGYANELKRGRLPHPRHWRTLANLVGVSESGAV